MKLEFAGLTHKGKRPHNEDTFGLLPEEKLFFVADGMGGHKGGATASALAKEALLHLFHQTKRADEDSYPRTHDDQLDYDELRLVTGIKVANEKIYTRANQEQDELGGMGCTIVALYFARSQLYIAHVGDSRAYCLRDGRLIQLTEDHSLINALRQSARELPAQLRGFRYRNVLVRALGLNETVCVDLKPLTPKTGDRYLLCSDGLSKGVDEEALQEIIAPATDPSEQCQELIDAANEAGGTDNITAVLVHVV